MPPGRLNKHLARSDVYVMQGLCVTHVEKDRRGTVPSRLLSLTQHQVRHHRLRAALDQAMSSPSSSKSKQDKKFSAIAAALLRRNENNTFKIHFCTPFCPFHHPQRPPLPMPNFYIVVDTASEDDSSDQAAALAELSSCPNPSSAATTPIASPEDELNPSYSWDKNGAPSYLDVGPSTQPVPVYQLPEKFPNSPLEVNGDPIGAVPDDHKNSVRLFVVAVAQARKRHAERPDIDEQFTYDDSGDELQENQTPHKIDLYVRRGGGGDLVSPPLRRSIKFVLDPHSSKAQTPAIMYDKLTLEDEEQLSTHHSPPHKRQAAPRPCDGPSTPSRQQQKPRWRARRPPTPVPALTETPTQGLVACWLESQQLWNLGYWTQTIYKYVDQLYPELDLTWAVDMHGRPDYFHSNDTSAAFGLIIARRGFDE